MKQQAVNLKQQTQKGFSLLELLVVIVILGILASFVAPQLIGSVYKAQLQQMKTDFNTIGSQLQTYKLNHYVYPTTEQGLEALVSKTDLEPIPKNYPADAYLPKLPKDPWDRPYLYVQPGEHGKFDIYSLGADGVVGGEGENADVGNWDPAEE